MVLLTSMQLFSFLKKSEPEISLGIDIGTVSIKVVEITRSGNNAILTNYAILELANRNNSLNNALQSSGLHPLTGELRQFLATIRKRGNFKTNIARLALPTFIAQTAIIDVPTEKSSEKQIASHVYATAGNYLPLPAAETTMKWEDLGIVKNPDGTSSRKILFMAIPTDQVMQYVKVAQDAGFQVVDVELENISIARALTADTTAPTLIIDIGGRSSTCTVAKAGKTFCITQTDFSSDSTTTAVAQALSISPARAESLKRQSAISLTAGSHELSTIVAPIIGAIIGEAARAKRLYEELTQEPVTKIVVCGAGSLLNGMEQYIQADLKQPVTRASSLGSAISYPPELQGLLPELNAHLTVAIGLALSKTKTPF